MFSVILPGCKTQAEINIVLAGISPSASRDYEVLLADPGGCDNREDVIKKYRLKLVDTGMTIARQYNQAAEAAQYEWLVFVPHAMALSDGWEKVVKEFIANPKHERRIGIFEYKIDDQEYKAARRIESLVHLFNGFGLSSGLQGIVVHKTLFKELEGFGDQSVYSEADFLRRAKKFTRKGFIVLKASVLASKAPYRKEGYMSYGMKRLTGMYFFLLGLPATSLEKFLAEPNPPEKKRK